MFVREARRRRSVWENLDAKLNELTSFVKGIDSEAEVYLFGSVAKGENNFASDIDILVVTIMPYEKMLTSISRKGFDDPFEIHVRSPLEAIRYKQMIDRMTRLL